MTFSCITTMPAQADLYVVAIKENGEFSPTLERINQENGGFFNEIRGDLPQKSGFGRLFFVNKKRIFVVKTDGDSKSLKSAAKQIQVLAREHSYTNIICALIEVAAHKYLAVKSFSQAFWDSDYLFERYKTEKRAELKFNVQFVGDFQNILPEVHSYQIAAQTACDLVNMPANVCTPTYLGNLALAWGEHYEALSVQSLDKRAIEQLGMGGVLGVAAGSEQEPRFIIMDYKPKNAINKEPIVLVGKGVTFDSGGISIKPADKMDEMKGDMGGAAAVFGVIKALCEERLPLHVVGLIASVENMPDGRATRPGDILKTLSGKTVEVLNTDAEGRLILCDALTYAERFKPRVVIDLATLTGAVVVGLGSYRSGLMGNNEDLKEALFQAGERAEDFAWKLPIDDVHRDAMKSSPFADLANISNLGREAGTLTAGAFLSFFAEKYPWAHLDIAGTFFKSGANKGATGRPVALLLEYLRSIK